jgi:predicted aldo/keto reductase-like oxidoreductase
MIQMADTAQFFPLDEIMAEYASIPARASACTECGECMERCPFDVDVVAKMRTAVDFFERRI